MLTKRVWKGGEVQRAVEYYGKDLDARRSAQTGYYAGESDGEDWKAVWQPGSERVFKMLEGDMTSASIEAALMGIDPRTNKALVQGGGTTNRRGAIDFTYSPAKSVSLAYAAAETDEERRGIMGAIEEANAWALSQLQELAGARRGHGGMEKIGVKHLAVASKTEPSNRNGDMDIHIHNLIPNMCIGDDGERSCLDMEGMVRHFKQVGIMADAHLMHLLMQQGYEIRSEAQISKQGFQTGEVIHNLNRVSKFAIDDNSSRRNEIEAMMAQGFSKEYANRATKQNKQETGVEETVAQTRAKIQSNAEAYGFASAGQLQGTDHQLLTRTDAQILETLHRGQSHFTEWDVKEAIARYRGPSLGAEGIHKEVARFLHDNDLLRLKPNEHGERQWASRAFHNMEQNLLHRGKEMEQDKRNCVPQFTAADAIKRHEDRQGFALNQEQREAAFGIACEAGGIAILLGRAGTGKTTSIGAVVGAVEANGGAVYGACTAWAAAEKLQQETGIECASTQSMLHKLKDGKMQLKAGDMVLLDEAGMVGTAVMSEVQKHCKQSGATLLLVGDPKQLSPVEAGSPMRALIEDGTPCWTLDNIRRQKNEADLSLVRDFYGTANGAELLDKMKTTATMTYSETRDEAITQAAAGYAASDKPAPIIATTNADVAALNAAVRDQLKAAGKLPESGRRLQATGLDGRDQELEVSAGDKIAFSLGFKDSKNQQIRNNAAGTVLGFVDSNGKLNPEGRFMQVELEPEEGKKRGRRVSIDTQDKKQEFWNHRYAMTAHKSQGQTMDCSAVLLTSESSQEDRGKILVMMSRHREQVRVFATEGGLEGFKNAAEDFAYKHNVRDLLEPTAVREMPEPASKRWERALDEGYEIGIERFMKEQRTQLLAKMAEREALEYEQTPEGRKAKEIRELEERLQGGWTPGSEIVRARLEALKAPPEQETQSQQPQQQRGWGMSM